MPSVKFIYPFLKPLHGMFGLSPWISGHSLIVCPYVTASSVLVLGGMLPLPSLLGTCFVS